jgi:hypothetical protein
MSLTFKFLPSAFLMSALCGCSATPRAGQHEPLASHDDVSALIGTWTGTYHQHSHMMDEEYPMVLELGETRKAGEVGGWLVWPRFGGARTAALANIANGVVSIYEGELVEGKGVIVGGYYFACLGSDGVMRGRYLCPDGDHKETFELRRKDSSTRMADHGIVRIGNELVSNVRPN